MSNSVIGLSIDCADAAKLALGATRVTDTAKGAARWTTFRDPEGNEFDLVAD